MGIFGSMFKNAAKDAFTKVSGQKDVLEAMCAACARTAAAEGGIDSAEEDKAIIVIQKKLGATFSEAEIEREFKKRAQQTATRSGKADLMTEIEQVIRRDNDGAIGKSILYLCLDVADEGGISADEEKVMRQIAATCKVDYDKLAAG